MNRSIAAATAAILTGLLLSCSPLPPEPSGSDTRVRRPDAAATSVRPDDSSITSISGLAPNRMNPTQLMFFRGWCSDSTGKYRIALEKNVIVDLDKVGPYGLDSAASRSAGEFYPYVLGNSKTGEATIVLSSQHIYRNVVRPGDYDLIRKLPWGFVLVNDRLPAFHFSGWENPFTRLTDAGTTPPWRVLEQGVSREGFASISLRKLVPDNARMAYILVKADNTKGSRPGSAYFRVSAAQGDGIQLGEVVPGQIAYLTLHQRITSRRELFFSTTGDVTLEIWVLGYTNTESS